MAIIGQIRRAIRLDEEAKRRKYEFDHRTRVQTIEYLDKSTKKMVKKQITHFPAKTEE